MYENGFHMWISAVGRTAMKRWLGILLHSSVNWWNVSLAWKACTELTWNTQHRWIAVFSTCQMFQHFLFFRSVFTIASIVTSSFNLISVCFQFHPPFIGFFSRDMATATPLSGSCPLVEENHSVLLQQLFMLACFHPLYMNTWAAFVSLALYQVTRHGCVCV